ncbi:MAG: sortase [Patescibacteria group bacterium]|uniref:Sortase n=1 Tax=candidate division WWE3 bacterium TaxID=2053526 RepID=A0A955ECE5_UNCKA|nr:sortase [candidate division WWE3 bacterium]
MPDYFTPTKYVKDYSRDPFFKSVDYGSYFRAKVLPFTFLSLGGAILVSQVVLPLTYLSVTDNFPTYVSSTAFGKASGLSEFEFDELNKGLGETNGVVAGVNSNTPQTFTITIPKLGIKEAVVHTNSSSLNPEGYIGHYPGTSTPDLPGTAFLYGHSALPVFYNPKNYKTIFSTLNQLNAGDEFTVNYNNKDYVYKVEKTEIKAVTDIDPLAKVSQDYLNKSDLILMTCWPAGSKSKRLLVSTTQVN